ncbi:MAG: tripartite tricarboxylate transporter TctB family protein [Pseudomonadota bacterium]|nr:tripartite tricarboxylate transporter TctB family protein [Pseudomonadota bacterium]
MTKDLICGGLALTLAVGYYLAAAAIPTSLLADEIGPGGLPQTYAIVLAALALVLIAKALVQPLTAAGVPQPDAVQRGFLLHRLWRAGGMLTIGILYVLVLPYAGYVLSIALLIAAATYYQGGALTRRLAIVAVVGAVAYWLLFVRLLGIPQPAGFWPSLL